MSCLYWSPQCCFYISLIKISSPIRSIPIKTHWTMKTWIVERYKMIRRLYVWVNLVYFSWLTTNVNTGLSLAHRNSFVSLSLGLDCCQKFFPVWQNQMSNYDYEIFLKLENGFVTTSLSHVVHQSKTVNWVNICWQFQLAVQQLLKLAKVNLNPVP